MMGNLHAMGCPRCSHNKTRGTHTFATYRVYMNRNNLKLICKICSFVLYYKFIDGAARPEAIEEENRYANAVHKVGGHQELTGTRLAEGPDPQADQGGEDQDL